MDCNRIFLIKKISFLWIFKGYWYAKSIAIINETLKSMINKLFKMRQIIECLSD